MLREKNMFDYHGHEEIERTLVQAVKQNKLHHGLLFSGQEGVGKATFALRFAAFLMTYNNQETIQLDAKNPVVKRLVAGSHADFKYVTPREDKASQEIAVEQIRAVSHFLSQTPLEGGWRIVVIDGELNRQASNALLKSLEEPPEQALIILIVKQAGQILPTIRSRCQSLHFRGLSDLKLQNVLRQQSITDFPAELLPFCQGSPGKALQLYQGEGRKILEDLSQTLKQAQQIERVHSFCDYYAAKPKKDENVDKSPLVFDILAYFVLQQSLGQAQMFPIQKTAPEWAETWQRLQQIKSDFQKRHLDRKQSLLSALHTVLSL